MKGHGVDRDGEETRESGDNGDEWPSGNQGRAGRISRRRVLEIAAVGAGTALLGGTAKSSPGSGRKYVSERESVRAADGTPPTYDGLDVVREDTWVETDLDTDGTGEPDRVHVEIARPAVTDEGVELPVIMIASPYNTPRGEDNFTALHFEDTFGRGEELMETELYRPGEGGGEDVEPDYDSVASIGSRGFGESYFYEEQFLPEGYAFAYVTPIGSGLSTGCNQLGGPEEIESVRTAVDWLNGRETAYDARDGGEPIDAEWSTGKVGMIGGSYRGMLANAVATTGVDGLETIVPIRSISSWYTYKRSEGAVVSAGHEGPSTLDSTGSFSGFVTTREDSHLCKETFVDIGKSHDNVTGNDNDFWAERDYVRNAEGVEASVLIAHGLNDTNTRPREASQWIDALDEHGVPYKVWFFRGGHDDPKDFHPEAWLGLLSQWFAHWLRGEDNGVMDEPTAIVEREDGSIVGYADWPDPEGERTEFQLTPGGEAGGETAGGLAPGASGESAEETLVDNSEVPPTNFLAPDSAYADHRLVYRTDPLDEPVRVSGVVKPSLELAFDSPAALVSAAVVDYGPDGEAEIVNRGWINATNRESIEESHPLEPGEFYRIEFPIQPIDHVFEPGHRLGVVIYASDYNVTRRPPENPELTLAVGESTVEIPVVGPDGETFEVPYADAWENGTGDDDWLDTETPTVTPTETGTATPTHADDGTDEDVPGFGLWGALASLGAAGYLLKRRLDVGEDR